MPRRAILVLIWMLLFLANTCVAASGTVISDVKITADKEIEKIQLIFKSTYSETVSTDFDSGIVQITLPHASFDPSLGFIHVNDRFIQSIRLIKTSTSTIMEVHFADPAFSAIGMIREKAQDLQLSVLISKTGQLPDVKPEEGGNLGTLSSRQPESKEITSTDTSFLDSDMTMNIIKMLVALFLLLLFFYFLLWIYKRFFTSQFRFNKGKYDVKVSSSYHISPKQKIIVLEVNGEAYACGVTTNNISVISKVSKDLFSDCLAGLDLSRDISFADIRAQYQEAKKKQETLEQSVDSDSKFASELILRIKNLKPLD